MSEEPRPGTTASLDRRVERLEEQVAGLVTDLRVMQREQEHTRDLMKSEFGLLHATLQTQLAKMDTLVSIVNATASEPSASPAGRALLAELVELKSFDAAVGARLSKMEQRFAYGAGAVAVLLVAVQLFGPAIRLALGLP